MIEPSAPARRRPRRGAGQEPLRGAARERPAEGRLRLLDAAERLFAVRGLGVPNREVVAAAGQHNQSAVTYHFGSRAGLIDAVRERHAGPVAQHRRSLVARLPAPAETETRQLVEAHLQPVTAEMLRCAPSYWARLSELFQADAPAPPSELAALMTAHLGGLPEPEAADRAALTVRFLDSSLARWERDSQAGAGPAPLTAFALVLTDLAVAMLDTPASVPPTVNGLAGEGQ